MNSSKFLGVFVLLVLFLLFVLLCSSLPQCIFPSSACICEYEILTCFFCIPKICAQRRCTLQCDGKTKVE